MDHLFSHSQWLLATTLLVACAPAGMLAAERAAERGPGARLAAPRALVDLAITLLITGLWTYAWMHGPSLAGVLGLAPGPAVLSASQAVLAGPQAALWGPHAQLSGPHAAWQGAVVLWHAAALGTAVALAGSAGAERARPLASAALAVVLAGLVLPLVGHQIWGGRPEGAPVGWLARLGMLDQGGAVVLHVVAGAAGLAFSGVLGPRRGRYDGLGRPRAAGSEPGLEAVATALSVVGLLGILGGGRLGWREELPLGLFNGLVGAAAGLLAAGLAERAAGARPSARALRLGAVAGVVAVSAGALQGGPGWAAVAGAVGGAAAPWVDRRVLQAGLDDPLGLGGAHLWAGGWGALAAAFVVDAPGLPGRLLVQGLGVLVAAAMSAGTVHLLLGALDRRLPLRVSPFGEEMGSGLLPAVFLPGEGFPSGPHPARGGEGREGR